MNEIELVELIVGSIVIAVAIFFVFEGLGRLIGRFARRAGARRSTVRTIQEIARVLGIGLAVFGIVAYTGLASVLAILTISGVIGLFVSLSLQATLSNVVAGILLLNDRAIAVGDLITYAGIRGRVARIALRNTWVLTDAGDVVLIGNSSLNSGPLVNHTRSPEFAREYRAI